MRRWKKALKRKMSEMQQDFIAEKNLRERKLEMIILALVFLFFPLLLFIGYLSYLYFTLPEETCETEIDSDGVTYEVCRTIIQEEVYLTTELIKRYSAKES